MRVGFLESGGGWIAPWLDRMDRHFDDQGFNDSGLKTRPSEIFRRNCWISFEPVEGSLKVLAEYIGPNKILWATDYPHRDGFFPGAPQMIKDRLAGRSARAPASGAGRRRNRILRPQLTVKFSLRLRATGGLTAACLRRREFRHLAEWGKINTHGAAAPLELDLALLRVATAGGKNLPAKLGHPPGGIVPVSQPLLDTIVSGAAT